MDSHEQFPYGYTPVSYDRGAGLPPSGLQTNSTFAEPPAYSSTSASGEVTPDSTPRPEHETSQMHTPQTSRMNSPAEKPVDEGYCGEQVPSDLYMFKKKELEKRDREAVAFSKRMLVEGDTLVYIQYPGDTKCFNATGFEVTGVPHRVHSSRLLATGSKVFERLLGPTNQHRTKRRLKLVGHLPVGVSYVIDLTPPDEGDEAVDLTSELSCSLGLRMWYTSAYLCGVPKMLVEGKDEVITAVKTAYLGSAAPPGSDIPKGEESNGNVLIKEEPGEESSDLLHKLYGDKALETAVRESLKAVKHQKNRSKVVDDIAVPDYCPARHRAGISRLLSVIEGKDPGLDSAPKVWTLFVLSRYFDCTRDVVDWIVTWTMTDLNNQFVEILPEASWNMACGLRNQLLCRAAFSILVSEEALSLASRERGQKKADKDGTNQFGRRREDIDEDLQTRIEYASKNFAARISIVFEALVEEEVSWMTKLPEYVKLKRITGEILSYPGQIKLKGEWKQTVDKLDENLRSYMRCRVREALNQPLGPDQLIAANKHRAAERYAAKSVLDSFDAVYNRLRKKERILTRFFWQNVMFIDFPTWHSNPIPNNSKDRSHTILAALILNLQENLNKLVLEAISLRILKGGRMPSEASVEIPRHSPTDTSSQLRGASDALSRFDASLTSPQDKRASERYFIPDLTSTVGIWSPLASLKSRLQNAMAHSTDAYWDIKMFDDDHEDTKPPSGADKCWLSTISDVRPGKMVTSQSALDPPKYKDHEQFGGISSSLKTAPTGENSRSRQSDTELPFRPKVNFELNQDSTNQTLLEKDIGNFLDNDRILLERTQIPLPSCVQPEQQEVRPSNTGVPSLVRGPETSHPKLDSPSVLQTVDNGESSYSKLRLAAFMSGYRVPHDSKMAGDAPFFNLTEFFHEAKDYLRQISTKMLDCQDLGFDFVLTDTLVCLGPEEFKYLPLWAGGDDDESGGVFDDTIPAALAGPNGPGPSFHTGFSSASAASSEFDTMSQRTSLDTSVEVEDGYSDHVDRRRVIADDDFHSETFSEDSEMYDRKGKAVDRGGYFQSAASSEIAFSIAGMSVSDDLGDREFALDNEDDNDDDANTTVGQADDTDDDIWDGGDAESFDFGDSDDEMADL